MNENPRGDYAEVNGLRMYYEVHSDGDPLVLLHGAYMTADEMGPLLPGLAENRRVIVPRCRGPAAPPTWPTASSPTRGWPTTWRP